VEAIDRPAVAHRIDVVDRAPPHRAQRARADRGLRDPVGAVPAQGRARVADRPTIGAGARPHAAQLVRRAAREPPPTHAPPAQPTLAERKRTTAPPAPTPQTSSAAVPDSAFSVWNVPDATLTGAPPV